MSLSRQLALDGGRPHAHLKLARALDPLPRRKRSGGSGRGPRYPDHRKHARELAEQVSSLRERHSGREPVLGIDPDLVMVIECNDAVANLADVLESAGLRVLEARGDLALAAFSTDPDMTDFLKRRTAYETRLTDKGNPRHQALFDAIDRIRPVTPQDVVDDDLAQRITSANPDELLKVDFCCWCTENQEC